MSLHFAVPQLPEEKITAPFPLTAEPEGDAAPAPIDAQDSISRAVSPDDMSFDRFEVFFMMKLLSLFEIIIPPFSCYHGQK